MGICYLTQGTQTEAWDGEGDGREVQEGQVCFLADKILLG